VARLKIKTPTALGGRRLGGVSRSLADYGVGERRSTKFGVQGRLRAPRRRKMRHGNHRVQK